MVCSAEIVCQSQIDIGLFVGSGVDLKTELVLFVGIELGGANHFDNLLMISFGDKDLIFIYSDLFSLIIFCIALLDLLEEIDENSQSAVKTVNSHPSKIDVVKFDGMNNFDMWRCSDGEISLLVLI